MANAGGYCTPVYNKKEPPGVDIARWLKRRGVDSPSSDKRMIAGAVPASQPPS